MTRHDPITASIRREESDEASKEAEQRLIAATFTANSLAVTLEIDPGEMGDENCRMLWTTARAVVGRGDSFTLGLIAKQHETWGKYCRALIAAFGGETRESIGEITRTIKDAAARRRLHDLAMGLAEQAHDVATTPEEMLATFIRQASSIARRPTAKTKRQIALEIVEDLAREPDCYSTGMPILDRALGGGIYPAKMIGFAARKKVGKTVLLGTISDNLNRAAVKHLFISHEMAPKQIEQRNMARAGCFNPIQFLTRRHASLHEVAANYAIETPDHTVYEHRPGGTLEDDKRMVSSAIVNHGIKGVIIDYWQLIRGRRGQDTEEQHLGQVAQHLYDLCVAEGLWLLIAAQINQQGNTRGGEGLKLACDAYFTIHREKDQDAAWLEMEESRYVPYTNVGSDEKPGLIFVKNGPYFEDAMTVAGPAELTDDGRWTHPQYSALK
jgi:replicative DNA helicase